VRLIVFAVLLASLAATLVGSLSYTRSRRALEREARARLGLLARNVVEDFHRALEDRVADITNWSRLEVMRAVRYRDVDKQLAQLLAQLLEGQDGYRGLAIFDAGGEPVASAGEAIEPTKGGPPPRTRMLVRAGGDRLLQLEVPIADPDRPGGVIGTLVAALEPQALVRAARSLIATAGPRLGFAVRTRAGESVVDTGPSALGMAAAAAAGRPGFLAGSANVEPPTRVDAPELEAVVVEPADVALAAVDALGATLLRVAVAVVLLGSLLGALVALWISRPIRRLTATVHAISASGRVDTPIALPPLGGEVGILSAAFQRMMRRLAQAQEEALSQSRLAVLGGVAASVAHEVRTPLSVLKASAQLLARRELPADEKERLGELVTAEVDRLNRVVTDLVDLARPRSPQYRRESMAAAIDRALAFFSSAAERQGVVLVRDLDDGGLTVTGSADQLHQVLVNLLHNAMQAMEGGGGLTVRGRRDGTWVVVEVDDTGHGFAPDALGGIFTRFRTTKAGGAGLGLVISRRIVEEHGGAIEAMNRPEGGARVRVRLPAAPEAA
jgi:signal transduction histidine kinase